MQKKFTTVKILAEDLKRIDAKRLHETEPRWSIIKRLLDSKKI